jgi:hypothetical protein
MSAPFSLSGRLTSLFALALCAILVSSTCAGQDAPSLLADDRDSALADVREKLSEIGSRQEELMKRLDRLESRVGEAKEVPSDFSRFVLRMESPNGKPLAGYRAKLRLASTEERAAAASGISGEDGVAIDRPMPYGEYNLSLREPSGWTAYVQNVLVEVGDDTELVIVAPDPRERGRVTLKSGLRTEAFAGLPFGEIHQRDGSAGYVHYTAEPNELGESKTFPTVDRGIEEVGASLVLTVSRRLKQPYGDVVEWRWRSEGEESGQKALATSKGVRLWPDSESKTVRPAAGARYFADDLDSTKQVACRIERDSQATQDALTFDVPVGDLVVQATAVYGRPTSEALAALNIDAANSRPVWLNVKLQQESRWIGRLFDLDEWVETADVNSIASRTVVIEPNDEATITLASP